MTPLRSDPSSSSSHTPLYSARRTPSKLLVTLRRSFSKPKEREPPHPAPAPRYRADPAAARPTIEQIAMGLHVSRTPHIPAHLAHLHVHTHTHTHTHTASSRSASPSPRSSSPRRPRTAPPLPPPPARSALKQPMTAQSSSLTTLDTATSLSTAASSSAPPTPSSARPRWGRLLFGRRASASISVVGAPAERKAVRFEEMLRVGSESEGEGTS